MSAMEPIQASLKKWMSENRNFQVNFKQLKRETMADPEIKDLLANHLELEETDIDRNMMKFFEYKNQSKNCADCSSLAQCCNILKGYSPKIYVEGRSVRLSYDKCRLKIQREELDRKRSLVKSLYMPKDILQASIQSMDHNEKERTEAVKEMMHYIQDSKHKPAARGLYFYGPFGVGKTYFLGALANELAEKNISSSIIYMPEFVREIKASMKDDSLNDKVEYFKNVPVLMFDDIGAESQSAWFRDEILGSILQFRMMEQLPVFFSSNYSLNELEKHLSTTRGDTETVKAGRIVERIKQVSKEVPLFGSNRRG